VGTVAKREILPFPGIKLGRTVRTFMIKLFRHIFLCALFYFICGSFNDAISSSDYIAPIDGMIHLKDMEGSGRGLI
jgi:hypothetical protein